MSGLLAEIFNSNLSPEQKAVRNQGLSMGLLNAGAALSTASAPGAYQGPGQLFSQAAQGYAGGNMQGRAMAEQAAEKARQQNASKGLLGSIQNPQLKAMAQAYPQLFAKNAAQAAFRAPSPVTANQFVKVVGPDGKPKLIPASQAAGQQAWEKPDATKGPTVQTLYDQQGREYKAQWNPQTQSWDKIGGTKSGKNTGTLDANQLINAEQKLFEQFNKATKTEQDQVGAYRRIEAIYQDPTKAEIRGVKKDGKVFELDAPGAADLALIFNYMKMLDPGSVVREGEFALAEKTGGLPGWLQAGWEKVSSGGRLSTEMRQKIVAQSRNQFNSASRAIERKMEAARKRAALYKGMGVDPARAIAYSPYTPLLDGGAFGKGGGTIPVSGSVDPGKLSDEQLLEELAKGHAR